MKTRKWVDMVVTVMKAITFSCSTILADNHIRTFYHNKFNWQFIIDLAVVGSNLTRDAEVTSNNMTKNGQNSITNSIYSIRNISQHTITMLLHVCVVCACVYAVYVST